VSTVFYRSADRAACQPFEMDDWPGGKFATATLVGTRPGGATSSFPRKRESSVL
jgi:hypothetical protein